MALPSFLQGCLASYDLKKIDEKRDKKIIITEILNKGDDIAAMKLVAAGHRPAKRDYIDIFYLLKKFTLKEIFTFAHKKYANFNSYLSQRALAYFEDLEDPK